MKDKGKVRKLAEEIAEDLFTDGWGDKASRLVMELRKPLDGPGWCRGAVIDRIEEKLLKALGSK